MYERKEGRKDRWMDIRSACWLVGSCMGGMDRWEEGWIDGWMDE